MKVLSDKMMNDCEWININFKKHSRRKERGREDNRIQISIKDE